jgi:hypothetical protein
MIQEAKRLCDAGRAVYVLLSPKQARQLQMAHSGARYNTIKFETLASVGPKFDWRTLRVAGMHPNCEVLVDHYVIEQAFPVWLEMLTRYDGGDCRCPECGKGQMRLETVSRRDLPITVARCPECGETSVDAKEVRRWEAALAKKRT